MIEILPPIFSIYNRLYVDQYHVLFGMPERLSEGGKAEWITGEASEFLAEVRIAALDQLKEDVEKPNARNE